MTDDDLAWLPTALGAHPPIRSTVYNLTDFHHLVSYLEELVRTVEPAGDPFHMSVWLRRELLHDDGAIDRILQTLRRRARNVPSSNKAGRAAIAKAISYIRKRRKTMRYATAREQNLPVGSGATESTCALMQVKRPGMAWKMCGLRGIMTIRGLVLSGRWAPHGQPTRTLCCVRSRRSLVSRPLERSADQDRVRARHSISYLGNGTRSGTQGNKGHR